MNTNHRRIKINVSWRWGLFFFLMSVVFSSCIDDFDVKKLQDTPPIGTLLFSYGGRHHTYCCNEKLARFFVQRRYRYPITLARGCKCRI